MVLQLDILVKTKMMFKINIGIKNSAAIHPTAAAIARFFASIANPVHLWTNPFVKPPQVLAKTQHHLAPKIVKSVSINPV